MKVLNTQEMNQVHGGFGRVGAVIGGIIGGYSAGVSSMMTTALSDNTRPKAGAVDLIGPIVGGTTLGAIGGFIGGPLLPSAVAIASAGGAGIGLVRAGLDKIYPDYEERQYRSR